MIFANSNITDTTIIVLSILGAIGLFLLIIFIFYLILASRRANIVLKKVDYLVEDLTFKSEMLNSSVELASKISDYLNGGDALLKGNFKSLIKLFFGNKNFFYEMINKLKFLFTDEDNIDETTEESSVSTSESNYKKVVEIKKNNSNSKKVKQDKNKKTKSKENPNNKVGKKNG